MTPFGARVAIGKRGFDEAAVLAEQAVVAAPRVDADALEPARLGRLQRAPHLVPQPIDVPSQRAVVADGPIRKAAHLGEVSVPPFSDARMARPLSAPRSKREKLFSRGRSTPATVLDACRPFPTGRRAPT